MFLNTIKDYSFAEFDYINNLENAKKNQKEKRILKPVDTNKINLEEFDDKMTISNTDKPQTTENSQKLKYEQLEKVISLMHNKYPQLMAAWFRSQVAFKLDYSILSEMKRILERKHEFFEFTQEQLEQSPACRQLLEKRINQNYSQSTHLKDQLALFGNQIESSVTMLSNLKAQKLIQYDMDKKHIELSLFLNKQDKLLRFLSSQSSRLKLLDKLECMKLNNIEEFKQVLEELIVEKSLFFSNGKHNSSVLASSSFFLSNANTNANNNNSFFSTSFSASMANMLSSTIFPGQNSPPNASVTSLSPKALMPRKMLNSNSLNGITAQHSHKQPMSLRTADSSEIMHIFNKFLILILSRLQSDEAMQDLIKFKNQVSVNFSDNLQLFLNLYETAHENLKLINTVNVRQNFQNLYHVIEKSIEYLYEEDNDCSSGASAYSIHRYDLSKIKIRTAKFLLEPLANLDKQREEIEVQFLKLLKMINSYKNFLASNQLERLKRELFVIFLLKPHLIESIVDNLNVMNY
jgi:hypothetical protein